MATQNLTVGSSGDAVKQLQSKLGITADGIYGNQTAAAVKAYQSANGLATDGVAGAITLGKLYGNNTTSTSTPSNTTVPTLPTQTNANANQPIGQQAAALPKGSSLVNSDGGVITKLGDVNDATTGNSFINSGQNADMAAATKSDGSTPPVRTSLQNTTDLYNTLKATVAPTSDKPVAPNLVDTYNGLRTTYGVKDLEDSLNSDKAQLKTLQDSLDAANRETTDSTKPMSVINGIIGATNSKVAPAIAALQRSIEDKSNQLQTKYNTVNTVMDLTKTDYSNAVDSYNTQMTQNMQMFNTVKGINDSQVSAADKAADNARSNLQIIYNAAQAGGISFDSMSADQKANVTKLELQAGLPSGFYSSLQAKNPKQDIVSTTTRDTNGTKYADIITRNADGSLSTKSIVLGTTDRPAASTTDTVTAARQAIAKQLLGVRGGDGYVSPENYVKARNAWVSDGLPANDFDSGFKTYVNPASYSKVGLPTTTSILTSTLLGQ